MSFTEEIVTVDSCDVLFVSLYGARKLVTGGNRQLAYRNGNSYDPIEPWKNMRQKKNFLLQRQIVH